MKPISELITLSKKIQNGSLNTEIPDYYKDGETAQLSDTLRTMQGRMKRYVTDFNSTLKEKRALEHELHIASIIQAEMLPKPLRALTEIPDIDIYARMIPAKGVAGDFYDYFFLDDYRLFFILGDVSGKGIPAAMFMARIITMIQIESRKEDSPGKVFSAVNNYLTMKNDEGMFVTAIGGVIDITSGELTLCDAGHNTPLMSFNSDDYEYKVLEKNTPLGILPDVEYKETALKLEKTDSIIIYSDGLTEAQSKSGKLLGEQTVKDTLITKGKAEVDVLANLLWNLIESFTINAPQSDDITLLILRYFGKEK
jgi:phosphoserine phosphatase RsbU/P